MDRSYLNIPYDEHIVPFPNFASVLMQHAREFPDKIAFHTHELEITYSQLLQYCISIELNGDHDGLLPFIAKLYRGIPIDLKFENTLNIEEHLTLNELDNIDYFEPPYVRLDDKAIVLNDEYEFSQYNVLVAAQAVGNALKLFREGAAFCPAGIKNISDLIFGILAPLYFAKSIYFTLTNEVDFFQYAWNGEIKSNLRDAVMVTDKSDLQYEFKLEESFEQALGLGKVVSPEGKELTLLGFEIENGKPRGHCLGKELIS